MYYKHDYKNRKFKLWFNMIVLVLAMILNVISLIYTIQHGAEE